MILLHNERLGCEQCIRGHRAADCQHLQKPLISIKGRGRPPAKDLSIRYRTEPYPPVISQTWEPIESKNGRGKPGTKKFCFHVDPNCPVETYQVKLGKGFKVIGPYDPPPDFQYQGEFRVRKHVRGTTPPEYQHTFGVPASDASNSNEASNNGSRAGKGRVTKPRAKREQNTKTKQVNLSDQFNQYQQTPYQRCEQSANGQIQFQAQPQVQYHPVQAQQLQSQSRFQMTQPDYLSYDLSQQDHTANLFKPTASAAAQQPTQAGGYLNNVLSPGVNTDNLGIAENDISNLYLSNQSQRASTSSGGSNTTLVDDNNSSYSSHQILGLTPHTDDPCLGGVTVSNQQNDPTLVVSGNESYSEPVQFQPVLTVDDISKSIEDAANRTTIGDYSASVPDSVNDSLGGFDVEQLLSDFSNTEGLDNFDLFSGSDSVN